MPLKHEPGKDQTNLCGQSVTSNFKVLC